MNIDYPIQLVRSVLVELNRKAELEELSAANQPLNGRGRKRQALYEAEAERLRALASQCESALHILEEHAK